tara:strand:+ start:381 stop:545 length:165 start_codon:yes stop_codon:yes gene_type:complete
MVGVNNMIIYLVKWKCGVAMWESTFIDKKSLDEFVVRNSDRIINIKEVRRYDWR